MAAGRWRRVVGGGQHCARLRILKQLKRWHDVALVDVFDVRAGEHALARPGRELRVLAAGRPSTVASAALSTPIVLVFGAPTARARWRAQLEAADLKESVNFVFVA